TEYLWRPLLVAGLMLGLLGAMSGVAGRKAIVTNAFFALQGFVGLVSLVAIIFWPSVRFLWPMALLIGFAGYAVGRTFPRVVKHLAWAWSAWLVVGLLLLAGVGTGGALGRVPIRDW